LRTIKKNITTVNLPQSKIKKITMPSAKKLAAEKMLFKSISKTPERKMNSKLMQANVGRTLDSMQVFDTKKRKATHQCMQMIANGKLGQTEIIQIANEIKKILGKRNAILFFKRIAPIQERNSMIAKILLNYFTEKQIIKKTKMN
jgi:hypothetical protein